MTQENNEARLKFYTEGGLIENKQVAPQPARAEELKAHIENKEGLIELYRKEGKLPVSYLVKESKVKEKPKKEK